MAAGEGARGVGILAGIGGGPGGGAGTYRFRGNGILTSGVAAFF